jgi:hypothetical protein
MGVSVRVGNRVRRSRVEAVAGTAGRVFVQPEHDVSTVVVRRYSS